MVTGVWGFVGCSVSEDEIVGSYAAVGYVNCVDTIVLSQGGSYERKVYAANGNPLLRMRGRWELVDRARVTFHSFFFNLDRDLLKFPELLTDTTGGMSVIVERRNGSFGFCTGYLEGENCYSRVEE